MKESAGVLDEIGSGLLATGVAEIESFPSIARVREQFIHVDGALRFAGGDEPLRSRR